MRNYSVYAEIYESYGPVIVSAPDEESAKRAAADYFFDVQADTCNVNIQATEAPDDIEPLIISESPKIQN